MAEAMMPAGADCVVVPPAWITAVVNVPPMMIAAHAAAAAILTLETNMLIRTPFMICTDDELPVDAMSCDSVARFMAALPTAGGATTAAWCARHAPITPELAATSPIPRDTK